MKRTKSGIPTLRLNLTRIAGIAPIALALGALWLAWPAAARAQTMPSAFENGYSIAAGGTLSGYNIDYGQHKIAGPAVFVDIDTRHRLGVEGEARWLVVPQHNSVHNTTWLVGARYSLPGFGTRLYPYAKGMVGFTQFNFAYNYAKGNYLVFAPGGGLDYRLSNRMRVRLIDAEYQIWPQFTFGSTSSWGLSTGIRYRVF